MGGNQYVSYGQSYCFGSTSFRNLLITVLVLFTLSKNLMAQSHYFKPTVVNSSSCNVTVSFLDGSFNVLYTNSFAPGTTVVSCIIGACAWVKYESIVSCSKTITCAPGAIDNTYILSCGNCCAAPCIPFNTAELPSGSYISCVNTPTNCNTCGNTGDIIDMFTLNLY